MKPIRSFQACTTTILTLLLTPWTAQAQTRVSSGFNLFSAQQDIEVGRKSAAEIERQVPILSQHAAARYVRDLGARLAVHAPGPRFPYQFKVANLSEVNAFALPGGPIYVHRGLVEQVQNEGQLAGVMAHEIAHVALRHSTNQASKAYMAQAGIGILGGLLGGRTETTTGQIISAVGGFGLNALFLKYSRSAETQADVVGAQIMAKAGYDPMDMVRFFEMLRQQEKRQPSKVARFLSDHPSPADRKARIQREANLLGPVRAKSPVGGLATIQGGLRRLPTAPTLQQVARGQASTGSPSASAPSGAAGISVERPSSSVRTFRQRQGFFEIQHPANWSVYPSRNDYGATIAPRGGFVSNSNGGQSLAYGVVVNHYVPFEGAIDGRYRDPRGSLYGRTSLGEATSDLVRNMMSSNPHLKPVAGSERRRTISGEPSLSVVLSGRSPVTGVQERVTVLARQLEDEHVVYVLLVAPEKDYAGLKPTFDRIINSLNVNDQAAHG